MNHSDFLDFTGYGEQSHPVNQRLSYNYKKNQVQIGSQHGTRW